MPENFRWTNCYADGEAAKHPDTIRTFLNDIIVPSFQQLDRQVQTWKDSGDPVADFALSDLDDLLKATTEAYCLAVQSLWERQIRQYVYTAARELEPGTKKRATTASWEDLDKQFARLRGLSLKDFAQHNALHLLHLLGNVCRHGDGPSLTKLAELHPELWPGPREMEDLDGKMIRIEPAITSMVIPRGLLSDLVDAVATFWDVMDYIYIESLNKKHERVERRLPDLRQRYAGMISQNAVTAPKA